MTGTGRPGVVVVGAGFAGLQCVRKLAGAPVEVTLVDRRNYHLFTPLLYQVASSLLDPSDIAMPVRKVFRGADNVRFRLADVKTVDLDRREVRLASSPPLPYDWLVLACGSRTNWFGIDSVQRSALALKDLPDGLALRNQVLSCFESAALESDEEKRREWMTFAVVGGGPTGIEYAGALSELFRLILPEEFPELDVSRARIVLLEATDRLLPAFPERLGEYARRELDQRGIEIRLGARVTGASENRVEIADAAPIRTRTLVWAAGVRPSALVAALDVERDENDRIAVDSELRVAGRERVFAIGDAAAVRDADGDVLPMMAPPAMQTGRHAAENVLRAIRGDPLEPFTYRDKGVMATIGRSAGVAALGPFRVRGFLGWILWLAVHLYYLIGFRNRLAVLTSWMWDYVRVDRPIRIILRARERPRSTEAGRLPDDTV